MIKAVIDTNVYISSLLSPVGSPAKIMKLVLERKMSLLVSFPIVNEYITAALYPAIQKRHGLTKMQIGEKTLLLAKIGKLIAPESHFEVIPNDPADNKFLECAVDGEADFIISGDKHLKGLKSFKGIRIVDPATFLRITG